MLAESMPGIDFSLAGMTWITGMDTLQDGTAAADEEGDVIRGERSFILSMGDSPGLPWATLV